MKTEQKISTREIKKLKHYIAYVAKFDHGKAEGSKVPIKHTWENWDTSAP